MSTITSWMRRLACLALALLLAAAETPSARAAPSAADAADVQYRRGSQAYADHKYNQALVAFQASQELEPSPNTRFKIAQCYLFLKKVASAYVNFRRAASEAAGRLRATHEQRYDLTRKAAVLEAAAIETQVPRLTLAVPSDVPEGFRLLLDKVEMPRGAWGVAVETDPGPHRLVAEGPRLKRQEQSIELRTGQQLRIDIPIQRVATATLALTYKTRPTGLAVSLDSRPLPLEQLETRQYVDVGKHRIRASAPGYADFTWSRSLADGDNRTVEVTLSAATGTPKWVFFTVGSAALAAAAVGTGFGAKAQLASNDEQQKPIAQRDPTVKHAIQGDATTSTVAFGVAGALGLTTALLAFTTRWRAPGSPESAKRVALQGQPILRPQQVGFLVHMEF